MTFAVYRPSASRYWVWSQASWQSANDWAMRIHPEDREHVVNFCVAQSKAGVDHEADTGR